MNHNDDSGDIFTCTQRTSLGVTWRVLMRIVRDSARVVSGVDNGDLFNLFFGIEQNIQTWEMGMLIRMILLTLSL